MLPLIALTISIKCSYPTDCWTRPIQPAYFEKYFVTVPVPCLFGYHSLPWEIKCVYLHIHILQMMETKLKLSVHSLEWWFTNLCILCVIFSGIKFSINSIYDFIYGCIYCPYMRVCKKLKFFFQMTKTFPYFANILWFWFISTGEYYIHKNPTHVQ